MVSKDPSIRRLVAKAAAHSRWADVPDRVAATAPGRRAAMDRWLREVHEKHPDIDHATAVKMADSAKRAFYASLALKSAQARRARKRA